MASGLLLPQIKQAYVLAYTVCERMPSGLHVPQSLSAVKVDHILCGSQTAVLVLFKSTLRAETFHEIV